MKFLDRLTVLYRSHHASSSWMPAFSFNPLLDQCLHLVSCSYELEVDVLVNLVNLASPIPGEQVLLFDMVWYRNYDEKKTWLIQRPAAQTDASFAITGANLQYRQIKQQCKSIGRSGSTLVGQDDRQGPVNTSLLFDFFSTKKKLQTHEIYRSLIFRYRPRNGEEITSTSTNLIEE